MPRYVHWTLDRSFGFAFSKKTRAARRGATTEPTAWNDCESSRRNSDSRGGPQVAMKGFADVSSVESPDPTMKQTSAKAAKASVNRGWPEHQRTNTIDTEPSDESPAVSEFANNPARVCEGTNEISSKTGAWSPPAFAALMLRAVWNLAFRTSRRP
jgi:hypothetical protein